MLFQPPGPAKRPRPALLSRPRMMLSQLAGSPVSLRPAVVLQEFATCSTYLIVRHAHACVGFLQSQLSHSAASLQPCTGNLTWTAQPNQYQVSSAHSMSILVCSLRMHA